MGQNLYTVSKTSPACGFKDAGGVKADLFQEMSAFCASKNLSPEVVTIEGLDGVIGKRCASATIEFRCVTTEQSDSMTPTGQRPEHDMNRNPSIPADRGQFGRKPDQPLQIKQDIRVQDPVDVYSEFKKLKAAPNGALERDAAKRAAPLSFRDRALLRPAPRVHPLRLG
jgi:hypothetical protein